MVYVSATISGNAVVAGNAYVMGSATVTDQARVTGQEVSGNAIISDSAKVIESGWGYANAHVYERAVIIGRAKATSVWLVTAARRMVPRCPRRT